MSGFFVDFRQAENHADLATMIGASVEWVDMLVASPTRREQYVERRIPKKNQRRRGHFRRVWQANTHTSWVHKSLLRRLEAFFRETLPRFPHPASHGYISGRDTRSNAREHLGRRLLLRADIEEFFESISRTRIEALLESVGIARPVAQALGAIVTIDDVLGQGVNTRLCGQSW